MRVTYTFELPNDQEELKEFQHGFKFVRRVDSALLEVQNICRKVTKYDFDPEAAIEEIREVLWQCPDFEELEERE